MADIDLATVLADGQYLKRSGDTLVGAVPAAGGSPEDAVDAVAAALVEGAGIDIVYDDTANTITLASTVVVPAGGSTILSGSGVPGAGVGADGNYYIDTVGDDMYGPKTAAGFGAEQTITVAGDPTVTSNDFEFGVRLQFARAGRITRIRYKRLSGANTVLNLRVWNDTTQAKLLDVPDTQAAVTGTFEITLGTPLSVAAGDIRIFSIGVGGQVPRSNATAVVVTGADIAFLGFRSASFNNTFPATTQLTAAYFVEPVYQPDLGVWPLALETGTGTRSVLTHTGAAHVGLIADAGRYLRFTASNPTYTVPPNATVAFPVGAQIDGTSSATAMTIIQGAGVTITKARTLVTVAAGSGWTLVKTGTDTWDAHGDFT